MKIVIFVLACLTAMSVQAQEACQPNPMYLDTTGVFPSPYSEENPLGGIQDTVCVDQPYEFVFTVNVGDSISIPGLGAKFPLNYARIDGIAGLPSGLTYACNPEGCQVNNNTIGCMVISGTTSVSPGEYPLEISAVVNLPFLGDLAIVIPGAQFPGSYALQVQECISSTDNFIEDKNQSVYPNPSNSTTHYEVISPSLIEVQWNVHEFGKVVYSGKSYGKKGERLDLDLDFLPTGIYFIQISDGKRNSTQKWVKLD